jgi:hypothetical protein
MSESSVSTKHVFLQEIVLRKQRDGSWNIDRLITNRGTFEILDEAKQQINTELTQRFVEYTRSILWQDILQVTGSDQ